MANPAILKEQLAKLDLFHSLDQSQVTQLLSVVGQRSLAKDEVLFWEQEQGEALFVILSGAIQVHTISADGREKILAILGPGELLGEMSIVDHRPRSATAQALEASEVAVLDGKSFAQLVKDSPDLAMGMLKSLSERLRETNLRLDELSGKGVQARIAGVLMELARNHGQPSPKGIKLKIKLTHQQLANYVGTSRETVTRTLLALQNEGVVGFSHRYLIIYNQLALTKMAQSQPGQQEMLDNL